MAEDVLDRVLRRAQATPDARAVVESDGSCVSYGQLGERITRLGARLIELGCGPEQRVALSLPKSADYVVSSFACWYAGAAFVPLDPGLPVARTLDYLSRASVATIIAHTDDALSHGRRLVSPSESSAVAQTRVPSDPERLAYVIFTSGSSGAPKGVEVCQRGLLPMLEAQVAAFQLQPGQNCSWLLSPAFDASVSDIGCALLAGACLHIADSALLRDPSHVMQHMHERALHYADLPPSLLQHLDPTQLPASLHTIVIGGEVSDAATVRRWAEHVRLINVYGPTEATVCTSLQLCDPHWQRPLLGRALPGVRYEIDSSSDARCGELLIGGPLLARGYLNDDALTRQRFVERDGQRWFRTGDRVRLLDHDQLEFLGRVDRQRKVRGMLVAPEEIEAQLVQQPWVRRAAVVISDQPAVVTAFLEGDPQPVSTLRAFLATRLPSHLIPARFVFLTSFPITSSGKPDLPRLRALADERDAITMPVTATERLVAQLFEQRFGLTVGRDDDFFALGGSSLDVLALIGAAQRRGLPLTTEQLYQDASVRGLAETLDRGSDDGVIVTTATLRERVLQTLNGMPAIRTPYAPQSGPHFVTGATGFLGARLVYALLTTTAHAVYCLVRARNADEAHQRVVAAITVHGFSLDAQQRTRLVPVCGDVRAERLGLSAHDYRALARETTSVFHCAAQVSHTADRETAFESNLIGTRQVLLFAQQERAKAVSYASTLSVFIANEPVQPRYFEHDPLEQTPQLGGAYAQSKWAAELLVRERAHLHPQTTIARLGLLTGDSQHVHCPRTDWLTLSLSALLQLDVVPTLSSPLALDITPVDYAARALVALACDTAERRQCETVHLCGREPVAFARVVRALCDARPTLRTVAAAQLSDVLAQAPAGRAVVSARLALQRLWRPRYAPALDLFRATDCHFDDQRARTLLEPAGITCPPATAQLLTRYARDILDQLGSEQT